MNVYQIISIIVALFVLGATIIIVKPAELPKDNLQRWTRSFVMGVSTAIITIIGFSIIGLNNVSSNYLNVIIDLIGPWIACVGLPAFIITTVGYYFGYRQLYWLNSIRKKINRKK